MYQWNFRVISLYGRGLLRGTCVTLELTGICIVIGTLLGLSLCLGRLSKSRALRYASIAYIEVFLALPLLVLLVWIYYCLPLLPGIGSISAFWAAVIAMSLNLAPFVAETMRAGLEDIPQGYIDAGKAVGMTSIQRMRRITLPLGIRTVTPPLLTQYITILKLSSLASIIAVNELLHSATTVISVTYRPLEIYTAVALIYLVIILPVVVFIRYIEKKTIIRK